MNDSQKARLEYKNSKQQKSPDKFTRTKLDYGCFEHDMAYGDEIYQEGRRLTNYHVISHSKLLSIKSMMDIKVDSPQLSTYFLIRKLQILLLTQEQEHESLRIKNC